MNNIFPKKNTLKNRQFNFYFIFTCLSIDSLLWTVFFHIFFLSKTDQALNQGFQGPR